MLELYNIYKFDQIMKLIEMKKKRSTKSMYISKKNKNTIKNRLSSSQN